MPKLSKVEPPAMQAAEEEDAFIPQTPPAEPLEETKEERRKRMIKEAAARRKAEGRDGSSKGRMRKPRVDAIRATIEPDVKQLTAAITLGMTVISPTAAEFNERRVDKTVDDVARLCMRHPRLLEYLKLAGDMGAYLGMVEWVAGLLLCIAADREMIRPDMVAARMLGVTEAWRIVHAEEGDAERAAGGEGTYPLPPLLAGTSSPGA